LKIQENIPLAPLTTFQVGGPARYLTEARSERDVQDCVAYAAERGLPLFVLGGGSNLVVADTGFPGLVLKIGLSDVKVQDNGVLQAAAGQNWDACVALAVNMNYAGIECLSGIPGTVGGTPVQNVGAYGQEVSQTIIRVRVLELETRKIVDLDHAACGFAYRTSIFNTSQRGKHIVLEVAYRLKPGGAPSIQYADVKKFFADAGISSPTLQQVRDAVRSIRQSKAMLIVAGDEDCRSAGSFFKNPVVSLAEADRVEALARQRVPGKALPRYPAQDGKVKLAAAWLVEHSGFNKGYSRGPVGISRKHSLAIVNRGGAKAGDIMALKDEVQKKVFDVWGVELHPEPVFVGFAQEGGKQG